MKFSDFKQEEWSELQPYFDTCLLPLTRLTGEESPPAMTKALEQLRDVMDLIEQPFHGRVITYPALHYEPSEQGVSLVHQLCHKIKQSGIRYVIAVSVEPIDVPDQHGGIDLYIDGSYTGEHQRLLHRVESMWRGEENLDE